MTIERVAMRLSTHDLEHLTTIATALNEQRPLALRPWEPPVSVTTCLRVALKVAAEAVVKGTFGDGRATAEVDANGAEPFPPSRPQTKGA